VVEVITRCVEQGAIAIKGNHDEALEKMSSYFNDAARAAIEWACETLSETQNRFLSALPLTVREGDLLFVHASAAAPERWNYIDSAREARRCIDATDAGYTFCGHLHEQLLFFEGAQGAMREFRPVAGTPIPVRRPRRWLAVVGTVGQPRDRNPAAAYTLFDLARRELTFFRVAYDAHAAADKIRKSSLPESLRAGVQGWQRSPAA
jgi:diadenosine tetraphosphatase ApaH/serine/threonine PP2A family protein phosphatase